jgi:hypothetical protein
MQLRLATNIGSRMKMNMKSALVSSIFSGCLQKDENVVVSVILDVVHGPLNTTWHFIQLEL